MKNELSRLKIFLVFVFFTITKLSLSQSIYTNPITGTNPSNNAPYTTGQTVATGITVSGLDLSGGVGNTNATDRFSADGWTTNANINTGDYFSWTITPGNCFDLDFTSLVIAYQRSNNGPQNLALRSSVDNYAANIWTTTGIPTTEQTSTISLIAAAFQNLTTPITFRLYGWAAGNGTGTFSVNSFTFNGAVTSTNTAVAGTISGINSVCSGSNTTLTVSGNTGNIQWQTSTDNITFTNITGATSATYTTPNLTAITYYRAGSTVGTCPTIYSSSYAVGLTSPSLTAVNASRCGPGTVSLGVTNVCPPAGSTTNWYAAATGGTSLATGNTFTTPVLNATTTYYASNDFVAGNTTIGTSNATTDAAGLDFTVTSTMLLNSVQVSASGSNNITVQLFTQAGAAIAGFPAITFPVVAGVNTLALNWTLPVGTYRILTDISGTINLAVTNTTAFPYGLSSFGSITGEVGTGASYKYFYNWNISAPRIPVVATVNTIHSDVTTSACGTYTWAANGVTYSTSGVYYYVGPCNTATLNLTISPATGTTTTASACGSYTWSVNGQSYNASGTYTQVIGCHTYTLNLTITPNTSSTTTASACDSYTWSADGQTYTSSGTYTFVSGCFTQTLELTITSSSSNSTAITNCAPYVWPVNGQSYSTSGAYSFLNGCVTENLALTITPSSFTAIDGEACGSSAINLGVSNVCPPAGATTNWYAASTGGTSLATGNAYTTPILSATTTYYASNNYTAGATLATGNRSTTNQRGLIFNAVVPILLNSVQINTNNAGAVTIELRNNLNQPVAGAAAVVFNAAAGTNTVPLGWTIPAGTGYRIIKTVGNPQLSRTDPFTFPIGVNGILSITSSVDAGAVDNTRYFYFYNWNVSTPRIPVVATIITPTVPSFTQVAAICPGETLSDLPTTSNNSITGTWSPALNNTATTTYTFTPTAGQCASTATMTITVNPVLTASVSISAAATGYCPGVAVTVTAVPTNGGDSPTYVWKKNGVVVPGQNNTTFTSGSFDNGDVITCEMTSNTSPCLAGSPAISNSVTITINPIVTPTFTQVASICAGETLNALPTTSNNSITGTWSPALDNTTTTTYTFTPTSGQCASTVSMTITVNPLSNNTTTVNVCDTYTWSVNGTTYTTSGTYTSVTGCNTETLVLTITPSTNNTTTASACDSYTWSVNGTTYTTSGTYTSVIGCNTETLILTITQGTTNTTVVTECSSYTWSVNGITYTTSGIYSSVAGCNTEILDLTITPNTSNTTVATDCDAYIWTVDGQQYTESGTYTYTVGCLTEILQLTITPSTSNTTVASTCGVYTWSVNGQQYTTSGIYSQEVGCLTEILDLTITPSTNNTTTASACDTYTWSVNGTTYTTSGTYTSVTGCHTETLVLTITPSTNNTTTASACDTYTWSVNGTAYTASGTYTSVTGCHTETLVLTITPSTNNTTTASACDSYTWSVNGTTYTTSGTYTSVTGCHTETLVLTITPSTNNTTTASVCDTYTWSVNGTTYTTSGTYTSVTGCHTETLVLTITPSTNNTTTASACDTYTWSVNGTAYTASGTYTSVTGCHTETLVLTITPSTNNTNTASACDTYTWSVNGTAYTASGTYTSVTGCHTETLVLTITPSTNNTTTASACDTYTWSVNGTAYTASGTYTSVTGCHTETLVLTITPSTNNTTTASACDSYTWSVNGTTYTTSGTYTSVTGCHTETLVLTVNTSSVYYVDADGDGFGSTTTANFCAMPSSGYSLNSTDCNDAVSTIYPGATELCNSLDDNCSGFVDEGCPSTIDGEEPFNSVSAPSSMYSYCSSFYGTLAGAFPSTLAQSTCVTGEDRWYNFTTLSTGITIFIGSNANDIVIELQDVNGNVIDVENSVVGIGTEVLTRTGLTLGATYRVAVRNYNSNAQAGGQFSGCIRHLRAGGADSGTSATWPSTLSTCSLFKASYCGGTGVQYRYTWTGLTGSAAGLVFTRTQTSDYLNVTAVSPSLHAGSTYNVLVTAIYTIPNGAGVNEVFEMPAVAPTTITLSQAAAVALRSTDQLSNGPRYRGSVVASLPWVCGVTNWRWRFTEVNPLTLQTVGLPIEQNRGAASNFINLNSISALQHGKTYAVQTSPIFSYTGTNYQWGPVTYMAIIGNAGLIIDASQDVSQDAMQDRQVEDVAQEFELNVYPNPSNGTDLNLNISGIESDNVQVKIYDSMGRKIQSERFVVDGTLQTELSLNRELSDGIYLIEVSTGTTTKSARILIAK